VTAARRLVVAGGTVVTPWGRVRADVLVAGERIAALAAPGRIGAGAPLLDAPARTGAAAQVLDARGLLTCAILGSPTRRTSRPPAARRRPAGSRRSW
jgi:hypothetical protein